jgi:hypothetical protein
MIVNVEAEVNKHRSCRDRDEMGRAISEYKNLARQHATNIVLAGQYNTVALKLQEICDKLPAPHLRNISGHSQGSSTKTATITSEENNRINAAWKQKTGGPGGKR